MGLDDSKGYILNEALCLFNFLELFFLNKTFPPLVLYSNSSLVGIVLDLAKI